MDWSPIKKNNKRKFTSYRLLQSFFIQSWQSCVWFVYAAIHCECVAVPIPPLMLCQDTSWEGCSKFWASYWMLRQAKINKIYTVRIPLPSYHKRRREIYIRKKITQTLVIMSWSWSGNGRSVLLKKWWEMLEKKVVDYFRSAGLYG